ncbi:MAG: recombinase family protein [Deltaproteobacteria bacterium]|nr:recombinase family protein [Deltaproteobacteria bacterium]
MYLEKGLSTREVAKKYGHSKSFVLDLLKTHKIIRRIPHQNKGPHSNPAYGLKWNRDRLCKDKTQQTIIKLILALKKAHLSLREICDELVIRGIFSKHGKKWHPQMIKRILDRCK